MKISIMAAAMLILASIAVAQGEQAVVAPPRGITIEPVLCTGIEERMPVGEAEEFPDDVGKVYLWTRITGVAEGEIIIHHVWLHEGQEKADVSLPVKGSPWRTYSYKTIPPEWAGQWEVKVVGSDGNVIKTVPFTVGEKEKEKTTESP
jgi:hypothetical protein